MAFFNPQLGLTIIPVNNVSSSRIVTLPPASTTQGTYYVIKNLYGSQSTIIISTTGLDTLSQQTASVTTRYGAWILANNGITNWFGIDSYLNSVSFVNNNLLVPFAPMSVTLGFVGSTLTATWTPSPNAVSYTVSLYATLNPYSSGGLLLQTTTTTDLFYSVTQSINDLIGGSVNQIFSYTGAIQNWTAPVGVTSATITMIGAGGGGGGAHPSFNGNAGGTGGYISGSLGITPGITYTLYVGGGGLGTITNSGTLSGVFGGGGGASQATNNTGGGGGGGSYILNGSTLVAAVGGAGGGGGAVGYGQVGGAGGGLIGGGTNGGTQLAGGIGNTGFNNDGSYLQGGTGNTGGGGGGGYYGGAGGVAVKEGSGGSDYVALLTNLIQTQGGGASGGTAGIVNGPGGNGGNGSITITTATYTQSPTTFTNINYYYATVTANNANGSQTTISSPPVKPILISAQPTGLAFTLRTTYLRLHGMLSHILYRITQFFTKYHRLFT